LVRGNNQHFMDDLLCAIANEDVSAVKSICKNSKGVHFLSQGGISALHIAAGGYLSRGCHLEILECLIESGADVNAQTMVSLVQQLLFQFFLISCKQTGRQMDAAALHR